MTRLQNVTRLEERIAPSAFAPDANYRCGNGPNGEVGGSDGGYIDPNADADSDWSNSDADGSSDTAAASDGQDNVDIGGNGNG